MFELLGLIFSGGATGLLGTGMSLLFGWLKEKGERAERLEQRRLDIEHDRVEFESRERMADREAEKDEQLSADALQLASYKHDAATYSKRVEVTPAQGWLLVIVDFLRGIIRPAMTVYLLVLVSVLYFSIQGALSEASLNTDMSVAKAMAARDKLVDAVIYLVTTVASWWFGDRMTRRLR